MQMQAAILNVQVERVFYANIHTDTQTKMKESRSARRDASEEVDKEQRTPTYSFWLAIFSSFLCLLLYLAGLEAILTVVDFNMQCHNTHINTHTQSCQRGNSVEGNQRHIAAACLCTSTLQFQSSFPLFDLKSKNDCWLVVKGECEEKAINMKL